MDNIQQSRIFGDYIIQQKIGSGGMASVFHALHAKTNEEVALKILHEHYSDDPHIRKRLEHEARIVMRLSHPSIVPVLDYGEAEKRPYLVMPYMEGGSLAQLFSKPRLVKHETTLKLLTILADGMDYAHSQEVVHRDLKLENILLSKNRVLAISDFGIAQSAHTTRITMTGQILGTPQYLAPENLDTNGTLNYRADLYALAVMAYLMLTGYFPFTAKDPLSIAIKHRTETAPMPSLVNQNLPIAIDPIFVRALAKNPDARFPSSIAFVEALDEAFSQTESITTTIFVNESNPVPPTQAALQQADLLNADSRITRILPPEPEAIPAVHLDTEPDIRRRQKKSPRSLWVAIFMLFVCAGSALTLFMFNGGLWKGLNPEVTEALAEASEEATEEATEALVEASEESEDIESTGFSSIANEEATSSPTATRTPRPSSTPRSSGTATAQAGNNQEPSDTATVRLTNTARPSSTPTVRPANTSRPSNTPQPASTNTPRPLPTNTPRPLPSNTPQPQPTSVPPTNPPAPTAVPPTSVPPTSVPPTNVPPTNAPAPTTAPQPTTILDPIINPVNTLVPLPCVPIPLVKTCP